VLFGILIEVADNPV